MQNLDLIKSVSRGGSIGPGMTQQQLVNLNNSA